MPTCDKCGEEVGWRDIESAPKDGTFVDLWLSGPGFVEGGIRITDAFWHEGQWVEHSLVNDLDDAPVWVESVGPCDPVETSVCKATHWMPLPPPPEGEQR